MSDKTLQASGPGRPKDPAKRAAILEAAKSLFLSKGYDGSSMDAIAAEAGTMGATTSVAGPTANLIAGPVRLLDIQLSPDDLGTVNVRMRLSNNGLEIRLRASNPETAKMLERDQSALLDLLAASGITADSITIVGGDGAGLAQLTGQDAGRRPVVHQGPRTAAARGQ
eukprot:gene45110-55183_t